MQAMSGVRVLEVGTGVASAYAGRLFSLAGADVIELEPSGGDPLRDGDDRGEVSAFFAYLNQGKRAALWDDAHPAALDELAAEADIVIDGNHLPWDVLQDLRRRHPDLVIVSISPFGRTGPYADRPANEFIVQAESGALALRGRRPDPPVAAGGRIGEFVAGAYGAVAAIMGEREARSGRGGTLVDVPMQAVHCLMSSYWVDLTPLLMGQTLVGPTPRMVETPSIEPTLDGWVGFTTFSRQMFDDFLLLIDQPELLADEELATRPGREKRFEEWEALVHAWTRRHTTAEILERASALRIPVAPVVSGAEIVEVDQYVDRKVFVEHPVRSFLMPRTPWRLGDTDPEPPRAEPPEPTASDHVTFAPRPDRPERQPLDQLRVLDLTGWWAGPAGTQILACYDADVIHVESASRLDGGRLSLVSADQDRYWERSALFLSANANKRGLTLDLSCEAGRAALLELVALADVVVENYSPRVMDNLGLGWDQIHAANRRAIMLRMPAFGLTGPWRDRTGFAPTMEQASGSAWLTGYPDGRPVVPGGPSDPNAGMHAAFALMVALAERDRTGEGQLVEVAMIESSLNIAAESVIEHSANGVELGRLGNRSRHAAPQGLYATAGVEQWVAVSVETDEQWQALCAAIDAPDWAAAPELGDRAGRAAAHDELDERIAAWAGRRSAQAAADLLAARGVPAGVVRDTRLSAEHPQLAPAFEHIDHPVVGRVRVRGLPYRTDRRDRWIRTPAPTLGEHNAEVLSGLLGYDEERLAALAEGGVIGTWPRQL